jgi:hypothetical protein
MFRSQSGWKPSRHPQTTCHRGVHGRTKLNHLSDPGLLSPLPLIMFSNRQLGPIETLVRCLSPLELYALQKVVYELVNLLEMREIAAPQSDFWDTNMQ